MTGGGAHRRLIVPADAHVDDCDSAIIQKAFTRTNPRPGLLHIACPAGSRELSFFMQISLCHSPPRLVTDQPKRRRSSAQPTFGGPPRKVVHAQPTLFEESELEEDELPIRKVGRNNKNVRYLIPWPRPRQADIFFYRLRPLGPRLDVSPL